MNWLNTILVLLVAYLAVFWEAAFNWVRHLLGAQIDLLPALMVYASLCGSLATVALLAHVLISKYGDHLPLYRQAQIFARQGMTLDRSTLCDWVAAPVGG